MSVFQFAPGDDSMLSYTCLPLNYIAATNKPSAADDSSDLIQRTGGQTDYVILHSTESALRGLMEEEKRSIAMSTISAVS